MADYLKIFATQADYEAYIASDYPKPNVSYIEATGETIYTNYEDGPAGSEYVLDSVKIADFTGTTFNVANTYITEANVPEGVTSIANQAFRNFSGLTTVNLPSTLTSLGNSVFDTCSALTSIDIPESLTTIGQSCFYNCTHLREINGLEESSVTTINGGSSSINGAFSGCTVLSSVNLPHGLTTLGNYTFGNCMNLTSVKIPSTLTSIGRWIFLNCENLTQLVFPSSITSIGDSFSGCSRLASITVMSVTPPTLTANAFNQTSSNLVIYVPAESVEAYKAAENWSTYASKIQAIPSE